MNCLLVEDHVLLAQLLGSILNNSPAISHYRIATTVNQAILMVDQAPPDLLILDLALPDGDGQEVALHLLKLNSCPAIVILSAQLHEFSCNPLLLPHIRAMVDKTSAYKDLALALNGLTPLKTDPHPQGNIIKNVSMMSAREQEVYLLIGAGLSSKEIAEKLYISPSTVESHRKGIAKHLSLSGTDLVRHAAVQVYRTEKEDLATNES